MLSTLRTSIPHSQTLDDPRPTSLNLACRNTFHWPFQPAASCRSKTLRNLSSLRWDTNTATPLRMRWHLPWFSEQVSDFLCFIHIWGRFGTLQNSIYCATGYFVGEGWNAIMETPHCSSPPPWLEADVTMDAVVRTCVYAVCPSSVIELREYHGAVVSSPVSKICRLMVFSPELFLN
jgi:hypothetical protein